jgi:hypothetical protein
MAEMNDGAPRQRKWNGSAYEPDPELWIQLGKRKPEEICYRALASYDSEQGFSLNVLNQVFQILPQSRSIVPLYSNVTCIRSFELDLVVLTYLLKARAVELRGDMVSEKDLPGGEAFFRGPHKLNTLPLERKFGENREAFVAVGERLNGTVRDLGQAAVCLPVLPRVPVTLILWEKDDEFPAQITVTFDSTVSLHLPLDIIWAAVDVASRWMTLAG